MAGNKRIKLQLWDTCGLEEYRSLVKLHFKGATLLLSHILWIKSLMSLLDFDMIILKATQLIITSNKMTEIPVYLIGTKADLMVKANTE